MAEISASLVKTLRDKTGAGMMDCKKALIESDGDVEAAVDWLRKKGLAAAKKAGRAASEGLVGIHVAEGRGAVVEVNAETDFVARNEAFQTFVAAVAGVAAGKGTDIDGLNAEPYPETGRTVADELTHMIATIGENMTLRRVATLAVDQGVIGAYMHSAQAPGIGRIGVLVALESAGDASSLPELAKQLAMHVAATNPQAVSQEDLDPAILERERDVLTEQARASGRPEEIIGKMVDGRLRKLYEDVCLTEQVFVIDGERRVKAVIDEAAKSAGAPVRIAGFVRFALGEGVAKKEEDFAAEVAKAAGA